MFRLSPIAAALCGLLLAAPASAHGVAGAHIFVNTLLIDDPNVADEASLPTFMWLAQPTDNGVTPTAAVASIEFSKRITEDFGISIGGGYQWLRTPGQKTRTGWRNLEATLKYKLFVSAEHEFMLSVGVTRELARTGASGTNGAALDNDDTSSTRPTLYWGKGFGDLPIGWARAFALTGTLGYQMPDRRLKVDPATADPVNGGGANQWQGGLSLQYSLRYLQAQVKDVGLPDWVNRLTPLVEVAWSSPASRPNTGSTQYLIGAGVNYTAQTYAITAEALFPGNRQSGSGPGFVVQLHLYFDDLLPRSLGRPLTQWMAAR